MSGMLELAPRDKSGPWSEMRSSFRSFHERWLGFASRRGDVGEIPEGEGRSYSVNGRMVAVFLSGGEYYAISDTCPHMGASLGAGALEDNAVSCPWHCWRFSIKDGAWLDAPNSKLRADCFAVRVEDEEIQVLVPDPPPRGAVAPVSEPTPAPQPTPSNG